MLSYSRLWLLLHRRGYSPRDIIHLAGISESTYRKMSRSEAVRMDVLERVCAALRVDVGDVCSFIRSKRRIITHQNKNRWTHKNAPIILCLGDYLPKAA